MEVTEVRVFLADEDDERLKAYATITFDNCFVVRDLKIINGNNGLFVAMPSKKRKDGSYKDIAHPIHSEFRHALEQTILEKYNGEVKSGRIRSESDLAPRKPIERVHTGETSLVSEEDHSYGAIRDHEAGVGPNHK